MTPPTSLLSGYRILDLTDELAAYGTRLLADWGAEVIKVEPPSGDPMRHEPPFVDDVPHPEHSLSFMAWHTNKKSTTLNRHCADGRALLQALLHTADALVWSGQSDYLADSQLNEATLRTQYPKLIFTTASGFGQTGPHAYFASSDLVAQAMGGVMWMSGHADGPPICPGGNLSFILTGLYTAVGTLSALWHRQRTGEGQHVDISQQDSVASILAEFGALKLLGERGHSATLRHAPAGFSPQWTLSLSRRLSHADRVAHRLVTFCRMGIRGDEQCDGAGAAIRRQ
ncbi:hypothetical protein C2W62_02095 [Candidatus Entotheonella serta]|nr:hypothetical protein C2W62_02095 [Candidatus Entotheonella serta]